nr:uncharacterized protein LOC110359242 isoform X6 [Columba livia]
MSQQGGAEVPQDVTPAALWRRSGSSRVCRRCKEKRKSHKSKYYSLLESSNGTARGAARTEQNRIRRGRKQLKHKRKHRPPTSQDTVPSPPLRDAGFTASAALIEFPLQPTTLIQHREGQSTPNVSTTFFPGQLRLLTVKRSSEGQGIRGSSRTGNSDFHVMSPCSRISSTHTIIAEPPFLKLPASSDLQL